MCTKGELGDSFCIERLSMNVPLDRYHTKANTELEEEEQEITHSIPLSWRYMKYFTRKTFYEKVFFFQSCYIQKEVKSIHLTNLHSLCEQVARSSTPSAKQKLNQLKLFSKKEKLYPHNSKRMWIFSSA